MGFKNLNLDELVRHASKLALDEVLSPLLEDEKKKQDAMEDELSKLESDDQKKDELDEADDEEAEEAGLECAKMQIYIFQSIKLSYSSGISRNG